jgi:hypothetical protein
MTALIDRSVAIRGVTKLITIVAMGELGDAHRRLRVFDRRTAGVTFLEVCIYLGGL